ncbi:MAG: tetratricopeptide repeat protein [Clostridia bacterium]|nr:tetratricopeptide repeat protein [Clostridia bacterium]
MTKVTKIDLGGDRLISLAADLVDNHNYIGALKMLNKNAETNGNDDDSLMLYAEIFDDMGLYEKCVNGWFKYVDEAEFADLSDCYEGLAVSYMNLGNEHYAAYYYNKLLSESEDIDGEMREEILREFVSSDDNPLKFSYPPALEDCTEYINSGIAHMKAGEYDAAIEEFDKVGEGNPKYLSARNYVAMCKIISDRTEEAEQECLKVLEKYPEDVQALTTLAAVKTEAGKQEEALNLARKLINLELTDSESIYKIATVCCENKLHEEAYSLFKKLTGELEYDLNIMYFKAVAAFNSGKYEECFKAFDDLCTIYPEAVTARYYYRQARAMKDSGEITELSYFYRLPNEVRESSLKVLAAYLRLSSAAAKRLSEEVDLTDCVKWCFDEIEGYGGSELQLLAAQVAVKAGLDELVSNILLDAFVDDRLKLDVLTSIAERNEFNCFGVVICHVYKRITFSSLDLGRLKRKYFVQAYARLVAHFSVLEDENGAVFAEVAENLYRRLAEEGRLDEVKNAEVITAVIYYLSGVNTAGIEGDKIYSFFEVSEEEIKKFI